MKTTPILALLAPIIIAITTPTTLRADPFDIPEMKDARIAMSYEELSGLLKLARNESEEMPETPPPLAAVLSEARYRVDLGETPPRLTATYRARVLSEGWNELRLLGGDGRLEQAKVESADAQVVWKDGAYTLLMRGPGDFAATLALAFPSAGAHTKQQPIRLAPAPATVGDLRVSGIAAGQVARIEGLEAAAIETGEVKFTLPGDPGELLLHLEERHEDGESAPDTPQAWSLHSQILTRYEDGRLRSLARARLQADSGSARTLTLELPPRASAIEVKGDDLSEWKLRPHTGTSRLLDVTWSDSGVFERNLVLSWETQQSPMAEYWELVPLRIWRESPEDIPEEPEMESRALLVVVPPDGLELTHPALRIGDGTVRLPDWIRSELGEENHHVSAESTDATPLSLALEWLPQVETAQATVSTASFASRLVVDGSLLVTADYTIAHDAPITWILDLPEIDQILGCEVNGKAYRPVRRSERQVEFRLAAPAARRESGPQTTVQLSYALRTAPLDRVSGRIALELPLTELFIHRLDWSISIPDGYEPTAVEGNVQLSAKRGGESPSPRCIQLEKELCQGERPAVEIHYQRRDPGADA